MSTALRFAICEAYWTYQYGWHKDGLTERDRQRGNGRRSISIQLHDMKYSPGMGMTGGRHSLEEEARDIYDALVIRYEGKEALERVITDESLEQARADGDDDEEELNRTIREERLDELREQYDGVPFSGWLTPDLVEAWEDLDSEDAHEELIDRFDLLLDRTGDDMVVTIAGVEFAPSRILKTLDQVKYDEAFYNWVSSERSQ